MVSPHLDFPALPMPPIPLEFEWPNEECRTAVLDFLDRKLRSREAGLVVNFSFPGGVSPATPLQGGMLTERDLADRFQCTPRTIRRWETIGDLPPSVTYGGFKRWRADDIDAWVELRVREAEPTQRPESPLPRS